MSLWSAHGKPAATSRTNTMILKNKYSLIHRPEPPAHPFTSEALFQTISRLIPTQAQINNLYRNRIISTFWLRNLKSWRGNCMRLFRCCTRWGTLHPIRAGASSLMWCTTRSATSSVTGDLPPAARTPQRGPTRRAVSLPRGYSPQGCSPRSGGHQTTVALVTQ